MEQKESITNYIKSYHTPKTAENYLYTIRHFLTLCPGAQSFTYHDITGYINQLARRGSTAGNRARVLAAIKRYYDFLLDSGLRDDHPCRKLTIRNQRKDILVTNLFKLHELERLFERPNRYRLLDIRNKVILSLLIRQGLTSEEVIRLTVSNIDIDQGSIYVKSSVRNKRRSIAMHPSQFGLFGEYLYKVRRALLKGLENAFVLGKLGGPMTVDGIHAMIEPLKAMYPERNLCPKTIRQSVISYWLNERNLPLEEVQDLAGHRYPSATEQYKRMDIEEKNSWVNQFHPMGREHNQPNR